MRHVHAARVGLALATLLAGASAEATAAPPRSDPASRTSRNAKRLHRVVIQVSQNDPALMNMALNNAENLSRFYAERNEQVKIEFVAYGPGLAMLRSDTSPVRARLSALGGKASNMTFAGCGNTMAAQGKAENKEVTLVPEAQIVQAGIVRIVELQEQGWQYVRP